MDDSFVIDSSADVVPLGLGKELHTIADDYDSDGFQEMYFRTVDGTAYLRALMHADGNIQYANYQSEQQMIDYLTSQGYDENTWGDWIV